MKKWPSANFQESPKTSELDHLIPLELGGDPTSRENLWMEPYLPKPGARQKDVVERRLNRLVRTDATARADRALDETAQAEADLNLQLDQANQTLAGIRTDFAGELLAAQDATAQIGLAAQRLGDASKEAELLRTDILPAIEGANLLMQRNALPAQVLGTLGGAKVTLGETAQTMKTIRDAMPELLSGVDRVVKNSDRATAASATAAEQTTATSPPHRARSRRRYGYSCRWRRRLPVSRPEPRLPIRQRTRRLWTRPRESERGSRGWPTRSPVAPPRGHRRPSTTTRTFLTL